MSKLERDKARAFAYAAEAVDRMESNLKSLRAGLAQGWVDRSDARRSAQVAAELIEYASQWNALDDAWAEQQAAKVAQECAK